MADTESNELTLQEVYDEFDVRLVRRGSDPEEFIDIPFKDVISMAARVAAEKIQIMTTRAAQEASRIIIPH